MNENCLEGIRCPNCGETDNFKVKAVVVCEVSDEGSDANASDHEWDDDDTCICSTCNHEAPMEDFRFVYANVVIVVLEGGKVREVRYNGNKEIDLTVIDMDHFAKLGLAENVEHNLDAISERITDEIFEGEELKAVTNETGVKELMDSCSETTETVDEDAWVGCGMDPTEVSHDLLVPMEASPAAAAAAVPEAKPDPNVLP